MEQSSGFGLAFEADFPLPAPASGAGSPAPTLALRLVPGTDVDAAWSGTATRAWSATVDGLPFLAERGLAGDHHFAHGASARFWLSADRRVLLCAPANPADAAWRRVLLDSVLLTVALLAGHEALHAAAVELHGDVVAVAGPTGAGKSSLAAALLRRGASLVADDVLMLDRAPGGIVAHPAPAVMTVPADRTGGSVAGRLIAHIGDELWIEPSALARCPRPLGAVVLLDRSPGRRLGLVPLAPSPLRVLGHSLYFDHRPERSRARFELFADLARDVPLYALHAPPAVTPERLADVVLAGLGQRAPAAMAYPVSP